MVHGNSSCGVIHPECDSVVWLHGSKMSSFLVMIQTPKFKVNYRASDMHFALKPHRYLGNVRPQCQPLTDNAKVKLTTNTIFLVRIRMIQLTNLKSL